MADFGNISTMLNSLDDSIKRVFVQVFQYLLKDIRFGRAVHGDPSQNFGGGFFSATTSAIADTEFSIVHTFGRKPYLVTQVLPLDQVGAKMVRLTVSRAADASRVYFKSPDVSAPIFLYIEG